MNHIFDDYFVKLVVLKNVKYVNTICIKVAVVEINSFDWQLSVVVKTPCSNSSVERRISVIGAERELNLFKRTIQWVLDKLAMLVLFSSVYSFTLCTFGMYILYIIYIYINLSRVSMYVHMRRG